MQIKLTNMEFLFIISFTNCKLTKISIDFILFMLMPGCFTKIKIVY